MRSGLLAVGVTAAGVDDALVTGSELGGFTSAHPVPTRRQLDTGATAVAIGVVLAVTGVHP